MSTIEKEAMNQLYSHISDVKNENPKLSLGKKKTFQNGKTLYTFYLESIMIRTYFFNYVF